MEAGNRKGIRKPVPPPEALPFLNSTCHLSIARTCSECLKHVRNHHAHAKNVRILRRGHPEEEAPARQLQRLVGDKTWAAVEVLQLLQGRRGRGTHFGPEDIPWECAPSLRELRVDDAQHAEEAERIKSDRVSFPKLQRLTCEGAKASVFVAAVTNAARGSLLRFLSVDQREHGAFEAQPCVDVLQKLEALYLQGFGSGGWLTCVAPNAASSLRELVVFDDNKTTLERVPARASFTVLEKLDLKGPGASACAASILATLPGSAPSLKRLRLEELYGTPFVASLERADKAALGILEDIHLEGASANVFFDSFSDVVAATLVRLEISRCGFKCAESEFRQSSSMPPWQHLESVTFKGSHSSEYFCHTIAPRGVGKTLRFLTLEQNEAEPMSAQFPGEFQRLETLSLEGQQASSAFASIVADSGAGPCLTRVYVRQLRSGPWVPIRNVSTSLRSLKSIEFWGEGSSHFFAALSSGCADALEELRVGEYPRGEFVEKLPGTYPKLRLAKFWGEHSSLCYADMSPSCCASLRELHVKDFADDSFERPFNGVYPKLHTLCFTGANAQDVSHKMDIRSSAHLVVDDPVSNF
eukprot:GHVU01181540.1.p1 GENE.GHVU01181540.1~~GHVU01181540.1.p1  ORF type:complete len:584 (+),score=75.23 GHVU01181540.1:280-2031(+)